MELFTNFWDGLFWFLVLLTPLVFVHELGHWAISSLKRSIESAVCASIG